MEARVAAVEGEDGAVVVAAVAGDRVNKS